MRFRNKYISYFYNNIFVIFSSDILMGLKALKRVDKEEAIK